MTVSTIIKACGVLSLLLSLAACALLWSLLDAEKAARFAERNACEVREALCKSSEQRAEAGLEALLQEYNDLSASFSLYKRHEKTREDIMRNSTARQRPPEEKEGITDDATRKKAAAFLNEW